METKKKKDENHTPDEENIPYKGHGPKFRVLDNEIRNTLIKLHKNLGHPDSKLFAQVLKDQQWDPKIVEASLEMQCPTCLELQKPKIARPAHLNEPREFNELVVPDGVDWTSREGRKFHFYHILDVGTNFPDCLRHRKQNIITNHRAYEITLVSMGRTTPDAAYRFSRRILQRRV